MILCPQIQYVSYMIELSKGWDRLEEKLPSLAHEYSDICFWAFPCSIYMCSRCSSSSIFHPFTHLSSSLTPWVDFSFSFTLTLSLTACFLDCSAFSDDSSVRTRLPCHGVCCGRHVAYVFLFLLFASPKKGDSIRSLRVLSTLWFPLLQRDGDSCCQISYTGFSSSVVHVLHRRVRENHGRSR
jgi:hypothetical protein